MVRFTQWVMGYWMHVVHVIWSQIVVLEPKKSTTPSNSLRGLLELFVAAREERLAQGPLNSLIKSEEPGFPSCSYHRAQQPHRSPVELLV